MSSESSLRLHDDGFFRVATSTLGHLDRSYCWLIYLLKVRATLTITENSNSLISFWMRNLDLVGNHLIISEILGGGGGFLIVLFLWIRDWHGLRPSLINLGSVLTLNLDLLSLQVLLMCLQAEQLFTVGFGDLILDNLLVFHIFNYGTRFILLIALLIIEELDIVFEGSSKFKWSQELI